jgi:hypothetical protein
VQFSLWATVLKGGDVRGIYVRLPEAERKALLDRADREWRSPREHATKLLVEAIRRETGIKSDSGQQTAQASGA